jgi:hypothetical protein
VRIDERAQLKQNGQLATSSDRQSKDDAMNLRDLTRAQLTEAHEAADCLCKLPIRLDRELAIKLDTLRADLKAAIEDRGTQ